MAERGYLEGKKMANAFNMLRSNDLIWPYVINNYLKGKKPYPFDLLYWNSDATRMPAANHSFYLRNCYLENKLAKGEMVIGERQSSTSAGQGAGLQSRHPRGSHRAGEIGVPRLEILRRAGALRAGRLRPHRRRGQSAGKKKYQYWTGRSRAAAISTTGSRRRPSIRAPGGPTGSLAQASGRHEVPARKPGGGELKPIEDAPGSYVKVQA